MSSTWTLIWLSGRRRTLVWVVSVGEFDLAWGLNVIRRCLRYLRNWSWDYWVLYACLDEIVDMEHNKHTFIFRNKHETNIHKVV